MSWKIPEIVVSKSAGNLLSCLSLDAPEAVLRRSNGHRSLSPVSSVPHAPKSKRTDTFPMSDFRKFQK